MRGRRRRGQPAGTRYDHASQRSAGTVIQEYSTSFGWASRLLHEPVRTHVRSLYALVRIADEIVDDPALDLADEGRLQMLEALEQETAQAIAQGRSTNLVVHAFALAAREHGIGQELIGPFFASMRADLEIATHDEASLAEYVHGSAEVVGLMCLRVFVAGDDAQYERLREPARALGSAFQKVNFLRDLAEDHDQLGRSYFPGLDPEDFDDAQRDVLLDEIDAELELARTAIGQLPASSRSAVAAAHGLYRALSERLRATPAARIREARVRVPDHHKVRILAQVLIGGRS
ncbi:MAG TPA: phytoene/squalene synthase family protein [Brachybacterium massiliense]|uniref:Phytoene/squalene synthase family protein n=1 Tax=Brachybacterium massiliense TaxID=1755098 RepID=A0A921SX02_9MICO|nr:phytoene/squalene synthase family protein [Brachybacterium massiliense]